MTILGIIPLISVFLALVLCSGCGLNLFPFGDTRESAPAPARVEQASQAGSSSSPSPVAAPGADGERRLFGADEGFDFTYKNSILTEDVTWNGRVTVSGTLTVAPQATVNIGPGTVVTFMPDTVGGRDGALLVRGRIFAGGTEENPIRFRPGTRKIKAGDWQGILLLGSDKSNLLEHCRVEGAAVGLDAVFSTVSLKAVHFGDCRTGARLQGTLFRSSGGGASGCDLGYALLDGESDIRDAALTGNIQGLLLSGGALRMSGSDISSNTTRALASKGGKLGLTQCSVKGNGSGITLASSEGTIAGNRIEGNREFGVRLAGSRMRVSGNVISRNTGVGLMVDGGGSAAWGNDISSNGLYDLHNDGWEDFRAPANWWGSASPGHVAGRIFDKEDDRRKGAVLTNPLLVASPEASP